MDHNAEFAIEKMCEIFKVSRSGYYSWTKRKPSKWVVENEVILEKIRQIHEQSKHIYGSPKITEELRDQKVKVSRPRVARLMKKAQMRSKTVKKFKTTTHSKHSYPVVENKLKRNFKVDQIGKVWVSDITYVWTAEGWLYLTIIMDLCDRRIIGWSLSHSLKADQTVLPAWKMAVINRPIAANLIFHSDRGIQYACNLFVHAMETHPKVSRSMSRKGDCWDNAVAESFFKLIKSELIYHRKFNSRKEAKVVIFEYIEVWYNRKRKHSALGYLSPEQFGIQKLNLKQVA